jgi:hypothetical protein
LEYTSNSQNIRRKFARMSGTLHGAEFQKIENRFGLEQNRSFALNLIIKTKKPKQTLKMATAANQPPAPQGQVGISHPIRTQSV